MNVFRTIISLAAPVCITSTTHSMDVEITKLDQALIERLVPLCNPTKPCNLLAKPSLAAYQREGRLFIAKMHIFGVDRYYVVNTDEGVQKLVDTLRSGHVSSIEWFYCDDMQHIS